MAKHKREIWTFKKLRIGQSFDWINPFDALLNSFFLRCKKTGARTYKDSLGFKHTVGTVNAKVYHVK